MEDKKLNLDAPFLSMRRVPTKLEDSNGSENTKKKKKKTTTTPRRKVKDSCQETDHETLIRLLQGQSFDHVMEPSLVPFTWEKTARDPQDQHHTPIEESDLIKALDSVSSTASFSANCSTNGLSEFENDEDEDRSSNASRYDVILEYRDLIMSRFLAAAEAIAMKQKKETSRVEEEKKKKHNIALYRVSMAINQDLNKDDEDDDDHHHNHVDGIDQRVCSNDFKKVRLGYLPRLCSKNSLDVLNPVLSKVKTCQDLGVKSGKIVNPKSQDSGYKTKSAPPRILRSNKAISKSQEPKFSTVSSSKSSEIIRIPRNPSRLQRTTSTDPIQSQETRFLVEEVKRRSNRNKTRLENLSVSQPPLPKTPSESWLCRTLPRSSSAASSLVVSGQATGFKKIEQKTNPQSIKWETIVKTSHKHNDHVRYSEELLVIYPSRQHKS